MYCLSSICIFIPYVFLVERKTRWQNFFYIKSITTIYTDKNVWLRFIGRKKTTLIKFVMMNWNNFLHDQNAAYAPVELQVLQFQYKHLDKQVSSFKKKNWYYQEAITSRVKESEQY